MTKTVLVRAEVIQVDGVYAYDAWVYTEKDGKMGFYHEKPYRVTKGVVEREIIFDIMDNLEWRASCDKIGDYGDFKLADKPFETHEIASDDVGNDMLEVAMAEAFPEAYAERNRRIEQQEQENRKDAESRKARFYYYDC